MVSFRKLNSIFSRQSLACNLFLTSDRKSCILKVTMYHKHEETQKKRVSEKTISAQKVTAKDGATTAQVSYQIPLCLWNRTKADSRTHCWDRVTRKHGLMVWQPEGRQGTSYPQRPAGVNPAATLNLRLLASWVVKQQYFRVLSHQVPGHLLYKG